jgi:ElaB/YqjD/DUF883 family membrane-anchored ribosome-binding protein
MAVARGDDETMTTTASAASAAPSASRHRATRPAPAPPPAVVIDGSVRPLRAIARAVKRRVHERPLTAVAAAVAVGLIVGGGLSFRLGRLLLAAASRHVVREVLKQVL